MGNDTAVAAAITDLAQAVREHTEHVKMDDQRYWDEKNADTAKEDVIHDEAERPMKFYQNLFPPRHDPATYDELRSINSRRQEQLLPAYRRPFPDFVVEFMQTTPHAFRRRSYIGAGGSPGPCRACELPQGNPIHHILLPQFPDNLAEDDD